MALYFLFFLSGVAALIYEVLWNQLLILIFGGGIWSVTVVVFSYMVGLALGSFYFGKKADKIKNPLKFYAFIEFGIASYVVISGLILKLIELGIKVLYIFILKNFLISIFVKFLFSFIFLLPPIFLMGGTFPIFTSYLIRKREEIGSKTGFAYGFNTLGGAFGAFLSGFFLLPTFGLKKSFIIGILLNIFIGTLLLVLAQEKPTILYRKKESIKEEKRIFIKKYLPFLFLLTGFSALSLEILWTRVLILVFGSTTYSFSVMLFIFLTGIAFGSIIYPFLEKFKKPLIIAGFLFLIISSYLFYEISIIGELPLIFVSIFKLFKPSFISLTFAKFVLSGMLLFLPCLIFGLIFPLFNALGVEFFRKGEDLGKFYAFNTVGSATGTVLTPLFLIPFLKLKGSFVLITLILFILSFFFLFDFLKKYRLCLLFCILPFFLFFKTFKKWDIGLLNLGVYYNPVFISIGIKDKSTLKEFASRWEVLFYDESSYANIMVVNSSRGKSLKVDGKAQISESIEDLRLVKLLSHLPLFFHPEPKKVACVGLGAGITAGVFLLYDDVKEIHIIEICKEMKKATRLFSSQNYNILNNNRVKIFIEDGFPYFSYTQEKYDIITSDPFEPLLKGTGRLYSVEYFKNLKKHLNECGIVTQWLPLYLLSKRELNIIIKTFSSVFSYTSLWFTGSDFILLGSEKPLSLNYKRIEKINKNQNILNDLKEIGYLSPYHLALSYIGRVEKIKGEVNTIYNLLLEFSIPRNFPFPSISENMRYISRIKTTAPNPFFKLIESDSLKNLLDLKRSLLIKAGYLFYLNKNYKNLLKTFSLLKKLKEIEDDAFIDNLLSRTAYNLGVSIWKRERNKEKSLYFLREAIKNTPDYGEAFIVLAGIYAETGEFRKAIYYAKKAINIYDKDPYAYFPLIYSYLKIGRKKEAEELLDKLKKIYPFEIKKEFFE